MTMVDLTDFSDRNAQHVMFNKLVFENVTLRAYVRDLLVSECQRRGNEAVLEEFKRQALAAKDSAMIGDRPRAQAEAPWKSLASFQDATEVALIEDLVRSARAAY